MADSSAPGTNITSEELLAAIKEVKAQHPDYGVKRIWSAVKELKGIEVSEKRVKKCMQDNGLTSSEGNAEAVDEEKGEAEAAGAAAAVSAEELLHAIEELKAQHPDYGIKRIWTSLKEVKGIDVSERRVKKCMQDNGLTASDAGSETIDGEGKKKTSTRKAEDPKEKAAFDEWCRKVLAESAYLVDNVTDPLKMPYEFTNYAFTGPLRPAHVTNQVKAPPHVPHPDYAETSVSASEQAARGDHTVDCKTGDAVEGMRLAGRIGREVLDIASRFLKVGVTGDELDRIVHAATIERGAYPSPLNYYKFPKSVCVSPNEVICHGIPDCRPIQDGDIVNLDISVYVRYKDKCYHGDLNETFLVGNCDEESVKLVKCAYDCLKAGCDMIRPGTMYRDLGAAIQHVAASNSCSVVRGYCGHGIGTLFHGAPSVPHYKKNKAVGIMRPGHTFTIEPMINAGPSWADITWPDNWTAVTRDGRRSAQFEHTFLVTETGVEILTARLVRRMSDDQYGASELRQRYGRGGTVPDSSLSASQLRGRYGVQNQQFSSGGGSDGLLLYVGIAAIIAVIGAVVYFMAS